jgi:hypothetical protein
MTPYRPTLAAWLEGMTLGEALAFGLIVLVLAMLWIIT